MIRCPKCDGPTEQHVTTGGVSYRYCPACDLVYDRRHPDSLRRPTP